MRDAALEFLVFGLKQARACIFVGLFFAAIFLMPRSGFWGIPRYDFLFFYAVGIQAWMVTSKLETIEELKAACLFHAVGFGLEVFKTSHAVGSWSYPDFGYTKIFGGTAVLRIHVCRRRCYVTQAWRPVRAPGPPPPTLLDGVVDCRRDLCKFLHAPLHR